MSMIGSLQLVSEGQLDSVMREPETIEELLFGDEDASRDDDEDRLDIDKSWHVLHFLLTGSAWEGDDPLNFLVCGGTELGEVDLGYGPARGFSPNEVARISKALAPLTAADLRDRFDPAAMAREEIYPHGWEDVGDEEVNGYFLGYFEDVKQFLERGAQERKAMIVYLS